MKMLHSFFSDEVDGETKKGNAKVIILFVVAAIIVYSLCMLTSNNIPTDLIDADEQRLGMRYEVNYGSTTFYFYDPMVQNPDYPLGSIEERAIEVVKKHFGDALPNGFEKDIKIAAVINTLPEGFEPPNENGE